MVALLAQGAQDVLLACSAEAASGNRPRGWSVSSGVIDFAKNAQAVEFGVERRFATHWCLGLGPHVGALASADGTFYVYGGIDRRFDLGAAWFVDAGLAGGVHETGGGKDLGGALEFRSGVLVGRRLRGGSELGLGFFHLSNSAYYRRNPGTNSLLLRWSR